MTPVKLFHTWKVVPFQIEIFLFEHSLDDERISMRLWENELLDKHTVNENGLLNIYELFQKRLFPFRFNGARHF